MHKPLIPLKTTTKATYKFSGFKTARFGRKTGGLPKLFTILFCIFVVFGDFYDWKPLQRSC
jgi:hypothetical protein